MMDSRRSTNRFDDITKKYEQRVSTGYDESEDVYSDDEIGTEDSAIAQQSLLPSVRDPKLWMMTCKVGKEREIALTIMQKFIDKENAVDRLLVKSVVCPEHLKGHMYPTNSHRIPRATLQSAHHTSPHFPHHTSLLHTSLLHTSLTTLPSPHFPHHTPHTPHSPHHPPHTTPSPHSPTTLPHTTLPHTTLPPHHTPPHSISPSYPTYTHNSIVSPRPALTTYYASYPCNTLTTANITPSPSQE
jgi:Early transcription elongation factor of RNA pol II, NGN section